MFVDRTLNIKLLWLIVVLVEHKRHLIACEAVVSGTRVGGALQTANAPPEKIFRANSISEINNET